jgi:deazaflavin-dependent oxidoreductase (nitroreductase family)
LATLKDRRVARGPQRNGCRCWASLGDRSIRLPTGLALLAGSDRAVTVPRARESLSWRRVTALVIDSGHNVRMRSRKYRIVTTLESVNNRLTRLTLRYGVALPAFALLETTGRISGRPRYRPVGNGVAGDEFWLIAAHGEQADYVRNIRTDPRVRVKIKGRWRSGVAVPLPADDTVARSRTLRYRWDAAIGRLMASSPLTIRIDLDPE